MKRFLLFCCATFLLVLPVGVAFAEGVRIGSDSGADLLPMNFNPSFNYMATPNAPAQSVQFVVYTADQGLQAAGDTCSMNGIAGSADVMQLASGLPPDLPADLDWYRDYYGPGPEGYYLTPAGWRDPYTARSNYPWYWVPDDPPPPESPRPPDEPPPPVVPEPSTMLILGMGLAAGVLPASRRFRRQR